MAAPKDILDQALALPDEDRARLAAALIDSLHLEVDPDAEARWIEEIERRAKQIDSGEVETIPWDEARRRIFSR